MTVREPDDAGASPWAGDVPVPTEPVEFTWAQSGDSEGAWRDVEAREPSQSVAPTADDTNRRRWALGSVAAVMLLALGWLVVGRGSGGDGVDVTDSSTSDDVASDTAAQDSLPSIGDEPSDTEPEPAVPTVAGSSSADTEPEPEWQEGVVELPAVLRAVTVPFDVVAMTGDGTFLEISIPGGRIHQLDLGLSAPGAIVAGATSTLIISYDVRQEAKLLRVGEVPTIVALPGNVEGFRAAVGSDRYIGFAYDTGPLPGRVEIEADGSVVVSDSALGAGNFWQRAFLADGSELVTEAGGVYRTIADGYTKVSSGALIAAAGDHVLVRECDDTMTCGHVVIDASTGDRTDAVVDTSDVSPFGFDAAQLSPDGRMLYYVSYNANSADGVLVDLETGETTQLPGANGGPISGVWAADSSGFFRQSSEVGFEFFDVATGEGVRFAEDLGRISGFDVRVQSGRPAVASTSTPATGIELIAVTTTGDIVEIDIDNGAVVTTTGLAPTDTAPSLVFADAQGAVVTSYDSEESLRFDATTRTVARVAASASRGPIIRGPSSTSTWRLADGDVEFHLVDQVGNELGVTIDVESDGLSGLIGSDGAGGVLVEADLGGVFQLRPPDQAERLTPGEVLAVNAQTAYVRECDAALQCGVFVIDRATSTRSAIDLSIFERAGDIDNARVPSGQNVSPDGMVTLVRDAQRPSQAMMVDVAENLWTAAPLVDVASPIIWTPDSRYAVWLSDGHVTVYERSSRSIRTINTTKLHAIGEVPRS